MRVASEATEFSGSDAMEKGLGFWGIDLHFAGTKSSEIDLKTKDEKEKKNRMNLRGKSLYISFELGARVFGCVLSWRENSNFLFSRFAGGLSQKLVVGLILNYRQYFSP